MEVADAAKDAEVIYTWFSIVVSLVRCDTLVGSSRTEIDEVISSIYGFCP
jgi:hypothetical protein